MRHDCDVKRGQFIGKVHSLVQEFYFSAPDVVMKLVNAYMLHRFMVVIATTCFLIHVNVYFVLGYDKYIWVKSCRTGKKVLQMSQNSPHSKSPPGQTVGPSNLSFQSVEGSDDRRKN